MVEKSTGVLARALYTTKPEANNELPFRKGDILTVIDTDYEGQLGWWMCALRGQRGLCPGNYLELIEDKYSTPSICEKKGIFRSKPELEGLNSQDYDTPRSQGDQQVRKRSVNVRPSAIYKNENLEDGEDEINSRTAAKTPVTKVSPLELYDTIPKFHLPIYATFGESLTRKRKQYGAVKSSSSNSLLKSIEIPESSLDTSAGDSRVSNLCYSVSTKVVEVKKKEKVVPFVHRRNPYRGIFIKSQDSSCPPPKSVPNLKGCPLDGKGGFCAASDIEVSCSVQSSISSLDLDSQPAITSILSYSDNHILGKNSDNHRFSNLPPESPDSGIAMVSPPPLTTPVQELYDVPRRDYSENVVPSSSRPQSSMSMSSSGMGLSIANSGSKDSLDFYDVPRSVNYVNHLETKYDQLATGAPSDPHVSMSSVLSQESQARSPIINRRRNPSCLSSCSAYGYNVHLRNPPSVRGGDWERKSVQLDTSILDDLYDVPRSQRNHTSAGKLRNGGNLSEMGSLRSVFTSVASFVTNEPEEEMGDRTYDVPSPFARKISMCDSTTTLKYPENPSEKHRMDCESPASSSFFPSTTSINQLVNEKRYTAGSQYEGTGANSNQIKILPLGPKAAVSVCERLRQEVLKSISSILDKVKPKWRLKSHLTESIPEIRFAATRLNLAVKDLCDFCSRCVSNAIKLGDGSIQTKLHRLLSPIINASQIIQRDMDELDACLWSVDRFSLLPSRNDHESHNSSPDALDQLVLCARSLKSDVTEISNFLALKSSSLFREQDPIPVAQKEMVEENPEDYDYVSLVSIGAAGADSKKELEGDRNGGGRMGKEKTEFSTPLCWRDEQLLEFYSVQIGETAPLLSQSISTFISAIHHNEPPKVFNGHLKFVILLAYKILFAGDTVHRNLSHPQLKEQIESKANDLNEAIVKLTEGSKVATREFPKIPPMQAIIDRVWDTTKAATQLKSVIFNATCTIF